MRGKRQWYGASLGILIAASGCARAEESPGRSASALAARAEASPSAPDSAVMIEEEMDAARAQILALADSARDALVGVRGLSRGERSELRQDVNARQVATARSLGVRARSDDEVDRLVRSGRLVELKDSTQYWILRDLNYSVPYVTPDTRAMLMEIGTRFHARLDSLGIPLYRMEITSVLRTPKNQRELRQRNANAADGVSAHEFGTTVDIAHVRFAPPADDRLTVTVPSAPERTAPMRYVEGVVLEAVARKHAQALQAELGRVLAEMRDERKLRVMMERQQAVYHMTVARRLAE